MSANEDLQSTSFISHLRELKTRVQWMVLAWLLAFIVSYYFVADIYRFLVEPLAHSFGEDHQRRLIYTSMAETFFAYVKLASYAALFLSFPVIAAQIYLFLAPGLYKHERGVLLPYLVISPLLFLAGAALAYFYVMPMAWTFFIGFEELSGAAHGLPIELEAKVSEYLTIVIQFIFAFGLAFQLPVVLTLLARVGLVRAQQLMMWRRYAVVILLAAAAVLTPPDVLSQICLFIPLYVLYEASILTCRIMEKRHVAALSTEPDHA